MFDIYRKYHVFDCDGVLVNSNALKLDALRNTLMFLGCPVGFIDWAVEEFRRNFGRTRSDHFNIFSQYEGIAEYKFDPTNVDLAVKHYGQQVELLYLTCPLIEETLSYISRHVSDNNMFVVSASNQNELRNILPMRVPQISSDHIFGGPIKKAENLKRLVQEKGVENIVFYGDAVQDAKAAIQVGVAFVGLEKYSADPGAFRNYCLENNLIYFNSCAEIIL